MTNESRMPARTASGDGSSTIANPNGRPASSWTRAEATGIVGRMEGLRKAVMDAADAMDADAERRIAIAKQAIDPMGAHVG